MDNLLSILGKIIVASLIGLFILYLSFQNKMDDKKYEEDAKVNFRGIKFQFPMRVHGVLKTPMSGFSRNYMWLQTDSIGCKNISAKWFFDFDNQWKKPDEISDELKQTLTYGVAFELHEDSCKTDQEIVAEIQNLYPGNYKYVENHGNASYIWERAPLTIFVKRAYQYPAGYSIPEVSFCYSLDDEQKEIYATYTGYIDNYPD
ncbi:hypothetical protein [Dyadobacter fanqingshengii]|uniref:Uncharacterized protein n=1 Tax=Dyadobacter fanqingshengii TaxID=2906443 RepID=A0A9X1TEG7_9BACT|nr:hypothetical protein [Dyadobacter fanqingshengii]MCF0038497.1 hypothetical protein [Dyadobacter fanqingshengii]USJ34669.1 hypothetical protein NFI81_18380 [Dyadobacter fanqingshengii]